MPPSPWLSRWPNIAISTARRSVLRLDSAESTAASATAGRWWMLIELAGEMPVPISSGTPMCNAAMWLDGAVEARLQRDESVNVTILFVLSHRHLVGRVTSRHDGMILGRIDASSFLFVTMVVCAAGSNHMEALRKFAPRAPWALPNACWMLAVTLPLGMLATPHMFRWATGRMDTMWWLFI